ASRLGGILRHSINPEGGSTFSLSLPSLHDAFPSSPSREGTEQPPNRSVLRFLVADDSEIMVSMIEDLLLSAGAEEVITARNGLEAWERFCSQDKGRPFTAILTDDNMGAPENGGVPFARRVKASMLSRPFMVMCSSLKLARLHDLYEDLDQVFDAVYEKPVNLKAIKSMVARATQSSAG
ncbi:MAG: hypothetical protein SGPRY_003868, partial [Prymnesium sp.]